jgi:hypothetical protein
MTLRARHVMLNNSFQTLADVRLKPGGHGTLVDVALRSSYFVAVFLTVWLGLAIVFNLFLVVTGHFQDLGFALVFPVFGFGLLALGRLLCLADRGSLLDFVRMVLSTR